MGVASLAISLLAGEISSGTSIDWLSIPKKLTFYVFFVSTIILCLFEVALVKHDKNLLKGITPKQYEAAIRNRVAEDIAKRSRKLIRSGEIDKLERETETFNRLYGEGEK